MREGRTKNGRVKDLKAVGIILLSLAVLAAAQYIAQIIRALFVGIGATIDGNVIMSAVYPSLTLLGLSFICKIRKLKLSDYRITKPRVKPVWAVSAVVMPLTVVAMTQLVGGEWSVNKTSGNQLAECLTLSILYFGAAVGAVEEAVFRGMIMSEIERCSNRAAAVIVPSVLFGILHIGSDYDFLSSVQVIIAGSVVGILFSLMTYQSGNIWSGALMHAVWNIFMCSGLLHIGTAPNEGYTVDYSVFNYIMKTDTFAFTGGEFGIEASIFAIIAYLIFIVLCGLLYYRQRSSK